MAYWHGEIGRKKTGGKISMPHGKRKVELGSVAIQTRIGAEKRRVDKRKNANVKVRALTAEFANVLDSKTKTAKKVKILGVVENKANPHFVRRLIITRGCVIKTELGNARVLSRPSQNGVVNAVKIE